jgi:serine phosphatase RsbU (regulator of sigma subunit)
MVPLLKSGYNVVNIEPFGQLILLGRLVLVADIFGHGVPASLISSMVKIAFSSQLPDSNYPTQVPAGINQILYGKQESDFVTAGYLFIYMENQTAT